MSVSQAVWDISHPDFTPGLSYVAVSRVRSLKGLLFETPFDMDCFKETHREMFAMRAADYARRRNQHIIEQRQSIPVSLELPSTTVNTTEFKKLQEQVAGLKRACGRTA